MIMQPPLCLLKVFYPVVPLRADFVPVSGHSDHAAAKCVVYGSSAGEGGVWDVLPGRCALSLLLLAVPHRLLPLRESLQNILKVSVCYYRVLALLKLDYLIQVRFSNCMGFSWPNSTNKYYMSRTTLSNSKCGSTKLTPVPH